MQWMGSLIPDRTSWRTLGKASVQSMFFSEDLVTVQENKIWTLIFYQI